MSEAQTQSIPFLQSSHEQSVKLRKRLEDVFGNISLVHDVSIVCLELARANSGDFNSEFSHVLQRCVADRLFFQMRMLNRVIERLGGRTTLSEKEAA